MGVTMWNAGEYSTANEFLARALKYAISAGDAEMEIDAYNKLCSNNRDQGNFAEGLKYGYKALETVILNNGGQFNLGVCYLEIGTLYQEMNNPEE
jgi:tetratricopeptide (TPR) repeat protein